MSFDGQTIEEMSPNRWSETAATPHAHVGWREADRQLRALAARRAALDADEARWLLAAHRAEVHRHLGLGSFVEYIERILGLSPRTTLERLRVAEALEKLPAIRDALATGRLSYSAVREVTRVAKAETEHDWLAAVTGKTLREVEARVAGHVPGDRPDDPTDPAVELRHLRLALPADVYALFLSARRRLETDAGERLSDADVMASLCEAVLANDGTSDRTHGARYQIAVTVCERCDRGWQDAAGQIIEVAPEALERADCDAQRIGRVDGDAPEPVTQDIPSAVRRQVERRDHGRCVVPGCRASRFLQVHHVIPRAHGGTHEATNLMLACTLHHRSVHDGRLVITGEAPNLTFTDAQGRPYGSLDADPAPNLMAEARSALRNLGFSAAQASAAVDRARVHVGVHASLEELLRAALQRCRSRSEALAEMGHA